MLEVVNSGDIVAVFVDFDGTIDISPGARLVTRMDLVRLHLARIDPRKGCVIVAKLEIAGDAQGVNGASDDAEEERILIDSGDVARRIVTGLGNRVGERAFLNSACQRTACEQRTTGRESRWRPSHGAIAARG